MTGDLLVEGIKHIDPSTRGYSDYLDHLFAFNRAIQDRISEELSQLFGQVDSFVVATTGSDARLEKGPVSLIELVLYSDELNGDKEVAHKLADFMRGHGGLRVFEDWIEVKHPDRDQMHQYILDRVNGEGGIDVRVTDLSGSSQIEYTQICLISPNRVFDARILFGNEYLLKKAKKKLAIELKSGDDAASIYDLLKSRVKSHRKVTTTGVQPFKGTDLVHYNLDAGEAYYSPEEHLWSMKQGPLRAVQYALVRELTRELRAGARGEEIFTLPMNTVAKLNMLEVEGRTTVSPDTIRDLADCYKYFLWLYHISQQKSKDNVGVVSFDRAEVTERCNTIDRICKEPFVRYAPSQ